MAGDLRLDQGPRRSGAGSLRRANCRGTQSTEDRREPNLTSSLDGKVALVTGSSSGIGAATAEALSSRGALVAINSSRSVKEGDRSRLAPTGVCLRASGHRRSRTGDQACGRGRRAARSPGRPREQRGDDGRHTAQRLRSGDPRRSGARSSMSTSIGTWQVTVAALPHLRDIGRRMRRECVVGGRRAPDRKLDPLCSVQGGAEPHDPPAGERRRTGGAGECGSSRDSSTLRGQPTGTTLRTPSSRPTRRCAAAESPRTLPNPSSVSSARDT